jgi:GT2 family glycosyltransferase
MPLAGGGSGMSRRPAVSLILPAYRSEATVGGCLAALAAQTFRDFETVLVDSGPGEETARIAARFPWVRYRRSPRRLLPHAARNAGVELAHAPLLAFSDPDVYAAPEWLERLVAAQRATGEVAVGALACFGGRRLDAGVHLCKFGKWLPPAGSATAGSALELDMSPTANMLLARQDFEAAGGFPGELLMGDVVLSRNLRALGRRLCFVPGAVVTHHHLHGFGSFLDERFERGRLYGGLRAGWWRDRPLRLAGMALASALPLRLARSVGIAARQGLRAGERSRLLSSLPVAAAGHAASLAGEALAYGAALARRRPAPAAES